MQGLARFLIRPARELYTESELGPSNFILCGKVYARTDLVLTNSRGMSLQCSWFRPKFSTEPLPCITYCHGNCGSRKDALDIAKVMLPLQFTVFAFDFSGSGLSQGDYVSLGYYESWDVKTVVSYLRSENIQTIVLWGRSMGAASAILYASCDPRISLLVLDSSFASLAIVMQNFIQKKVKFSSLFSFLYEGIRKSVLQKAKFDVVDVKPEAYIKACRMPAIFLHGVDDALVPVDHSRALFEAYSGDKFLLELGGGHNSGRPPHILTKIHSILIEALATPNYYEEDGLLTTRTHMPGFKKVYNKN